MGTIVVDKGVKLGIRVVIAIVGDFLLHMCQVFPVAVDGPFGVVLGKIIIVVGLPFHQHMVIHFVERSVYIDGFRKLEEFFRASSLRVVLYAIVVGHVVVVFELVIRLNGEVVAAKALANGGQLEGVGSCTVVAGRFYIAAFAVIVAADTGMDKCIAVGVAGSTFELIGDGHRTVGCYAEVAVPLHFAHN